MKKQILIIPAIIALGAGMASSTYADTATDFSITVNPSISLSVSASSVNLSITPSKTGVYDSDTLSVTASTNNTTGYNLTMAATSSSLTSSTINPVTGTEPTIPSIAASQDGISAADFAATTSSDYLNHWGLAIDSGNFNAVPTTSQTIKTSNVNIIDDVTTLTMASKLDLLTVPGVYSTTLNFQMTANPLPDTLESAYAKANKQKTTIGGKEYYAMQDMQSIICDDVDVIDDQLRVYDKRDNKIYWIAKLADGNCWMTQNLDFDITSAALSSETTDLTYYGDKGYDTANGYTKDANTDIIYWTPASTANSTNKTIASDGTITGWVDSYNDPYSMNPGDWYWTNTWYSSSIYNYLDIDNDGAGDKFFTSPQQGNNTHGHVGNYYNWAAAIASNNPSSFTNDSISANPDNPQNSICPAGWRLPTISGPLTDLMVDYANLLAEYGNSSTGYERDRFVAANPLFFVRSGRVITNSLNYAGSYGYYATSAVFGPSNIYGLGMSSGYVNSSLDITKSYGLSVRCIAK